jgi:HSP20 family protein
MTLERFDPKNRLTTLRDAIDRLFDEAWTTPGRFFREEVNLAPVDVSEDEQTVTVKAALPGIEREHIEVNVSGNTLRIRGEHRAEEEKKEQNFHRREIRYGSVERVIDLPTAVDDENAEATFKDGMLTLVLKKKEVAKPKTIPISG